MGPIHTGRLAEAITGRPPAPVGFRDPLGLPALGRTVRRARAADGIRSLIHGPVQSAELIGAGPSALYLQAADRTVFAVLADDAVVLPLGIVAAARSDQLQLGRARPGPAWVGRGEVSITGLDDLSVRADAGIVTTVPRGRPTRPTSEWLIAAALSLDTAATGLSTAQRRELIGGEPAELAARLCGLGPGLTPAGDDALCGLLLAGYAGWYPAEVAVALRVAVAGARSRTTTVSAALLRHAAHGRAAVAVRALLTAHPTHLPGAWRAVRAIGHTSGAAVLAGLVAGLARG